MKSILTYFITVLVFLGFNTSEAQEVRVYKKPSFREAWHKPTVHPDRIALTLAEDPSSAMNVTWRTSNDVKKGYAEIAVAKAAPKFWREATTYDAETQQVTRKEEDLYDLDATYHTVKFKNLKPNTLYGYRVGDGDHWSEWFQFRTAKKEEGRFSFLYVGDAQNYILELWSRLIREGYRINPNANFIIHAGDLINNANNDHEWSEWFRAGSYIHSVVPAFPVPGNHEYRPIVKGGERHLSLLWRPQFELPMNGPKGLEESVYYVDYQGARIIGLNSNEQREIQAKWLEDVLKNNPNKWTIVTFHHPLFSASEGRDNKEWRELLKPIFDKYHVDLVLQGHDHSYARGRVAPLEYNLVSGVNKKDQTGTVYVVSVSGGKMYGLRKNAWNDLDADRERAAENTQLIQSIFVDGDALKYESYTATGELYDAFEILKNSEGPNTFVELKHNAVDTKLFSNTISYNDRLPDSLKNKVEKAYSGHKITRVSAYKKDGKLYYQVRLIDQNGDKKYINIDKNGMITEE